MIDPSGPDTFIHKPDELVSITELQHVRDVFARLIERYCVPTS